MIYENIEIIMLPRPLLFIYKLVIKHIILSTKYTRVGNIACAAEQVYYNHNLNVDNDFKITQRIKINDIAPVESASKKQNMKKRYIKHNIMRKCYFQHILYIKGWRQTYNAQNKWYQREIEIFRKKIKKSSINCKKHTNSGCNAYKLPKLANRRNINNKKTEKALKSQLDIKNKKPLPNFDTSLQVFRTKMYVNLIDKHLLETNGIKYQNIRDIDSIDKNENNKNFTINENQIQINIISQENNCIKILKVNNIVKSEGNLSIENNGKISGKVSIAIMDCLKFFKHETLKFCIHTVSLNRICEKFICIENKFYDLKYRKFENFVAKNEYKKNLTVFNCLKIHNFLSYNSFYKADTLEDLIKFYTDFFHNKLTLSFINFDQLFSTFNNYASETNLKFDALIINVKEVVLSILIKYLDQIALLFPQISYLIKYMATLESNEIFFLNQKEKLIYLMMLNTFILFINADWKAFIKKIKVNAKIVEKNFSHHCITGFKWRVNAFLHPQLNFFFATKCVYNEILAYLLCPMISHGCFIRYVNFMVFDNIFCYKAFTKICLRLTNYKIRFVFPIILKISALFFIDEITHNLLKHQNLIYSDVKKLEDLPLNYFSCLYTVMKNLEYDESYLFNKPNLMYIRCEAALKSFYKHSERCYIFLNTCIMYFKYNNTPTLSKIKENYGNELYDCKKAYADFTYLNDNYNIVFLMSLSTNEAKIFCKFCVEIIIKTYSFI
ncbi:hypothetical protein COBT_001824 [Conglomerata obtusa]